MTDGPDVVRELVGPHQSLNLIQEAVTQLRQQLAACPAQEDPLTSAIYRTWDRRSMIKLGAAFGHLRHAQACGHITPEVYRKIYMELLGVMTRAAANVEMGTGP